MEATLDMTSSKPISQRVVGPVLSGLSIAFLLLDGAMKVASAAPVLEASAKLGYPASTMPGIGAVLLLCTVIYAVPRTAVLGAVLLTGYLGGAVATHVRVGDPVFAVVFPVLVGALVWGGLFLREPRLHALVPLVTKRS